MGVEEAGRARGGGKKLALASIGFADVRVGAAGGAGYREDLLEVRLPLPGPKDDGGLAVRLPDVGAAVRVSNCRSQCPSLMPVMLRMCDSMSGKWWLRLSMWLMRLERFWDWIGDKRRELGFLIESVMPVCS